MPSQTKRIFTTVAAPTAWTLIASFGTAPAFMRGSFHNRATVPALIELAIIAAADVPADPNALAAALDARIIAVEKNCTQFEGIAIGAAVPVLLEPDDLVYLRSDQALTHATIFATLESA